MQTVWKYVQNGVKRFFLLGCLVLSACQCLSQVSYYVAIDNRETRARSRMHEASWAARHEQILKGVHGHEHDIDLVFVGDSITQNWEQAGIRRNSRFFTIWDYYYGKRHAINLGFAADTTANVLWRLDNGEVHGISPKLIVVMIGINNILLDGATSGQTASGIDAVIDRLHTYLPQAHILLLGILPCKFDQSITNKTLAVNELLAAKYTQESASGASLNLGSNRNSNQIVEYINLGSLFMKDGGINESLYAEKPGGPLLHPTARAMEQMAEVLEPTIKRLLSEN